MSLPSRNNGLPDMQQVEGSSGGSLESHAVEDRNFIGC